MQLAGPAVLAFAVACSQPAPQSIHLSNAAPPTDAGPSGAGWWCSDPHSCARTEALCIDEQQLPPNDEPAPCTRAEVAYCVRSSCATTLAGCEDLRSSFMGANKPPCLESR